MSRRALEVLAVVVLALAALVVLGPRPAARVPLQRVFPARAHHVVLEEPGVSLARVDLKDATVDGLPLEEGAARDLAQALEHLSYRRRVPAADPTGRGLGRPRRVITVDGLVLRVGAAVPDLGQVWASLGDGYDLLLDASATRELERGRDDLRRRTPFLYATFVPSPLKLLRGSLIVFHDDPFYVDTPGGPTRADRMRVRAVLDRLRDLSLVSFLPAVPPGRPELRVEVAGQSLALFAGDACGAGLRATVSEAGAGCIKAEDAAALEALSVDPADWLAPVLITTPIPDTQAIDGPGLELRRQGPSWTLNGVPVPDRAMEALFDELGSLRGTPSLAPSPVSRPEGADWLRFSTDTGSETVWATSTTAGREGEPVTLAVTGAARAVLRIDAVRLADRSVLQFEPTSLARIEADGEKVERGATGESWRLVAPVALPADAETVQALRDAAAGLTARAVVREGLGFPGRRLILGTDETPGGPAAEHILEIAGDRPLGCHARRPDRPLVYVLAPAACQALLAHLATRDVFAATPDEITAVTRGGRRVERHGARWLTAAGVELSADEATALVAFVAALRRAPGVSGYGEPSGEEVVVESAAETVTLRVGAKEYGRIGRRVIYSR